MNPDDYDNDGNNIVPCPICLSNYCPSKEDGKCPEEDMFALEGDIRLLLDEYKATDDNSRIANVLEAVERILTNHNQSIHTSLVAAVKEKAYKPWDHYNDIPGEVEMVKLDDTLTIINSIFKEQYDTRFRFC